MCNIAIEHMFLMCVSMLAGLPAMKATLIAVAAVALCAALAVAQPQFGGPGVNTFLFLSAAYLMTSCSSMQAFIPISVMAAATNAE